VTLKRESLEYFRCESASSIILCDAKVGHVDRPYERGKPMKTVSTRSVSVSRHIHRVIALLALCASACAGTKHVSSLQSFAQHGQRTLFEVIDGRGRSWKVGSVETPSATTYLVVSDGGRVSIIGTTFSDRLGGRHAVVFVDSAEKEEALAVLDRKFLAGVANASDPYKKWLDKSEPFTYGSAPHTRRIDMEAGGLGSSDIRVEGNAIVGSIKDAKCHCYQMGPACATLPTPWQACLNKICDFANCIIGAINGNDTDCAQEGSDARMTCQLAAGVEPS
jgi:hypothetical protein